ncbi:unnamed protein product [Ascophyllum nodosum]
MTLLASAAEPIDFDDTWFVLESALVPILQDLGRGLPNDLWMSLYTKVYKLCTKPMDPQHSKLYSKLKETLELYASGVLKGLLSFNNCTGHSNTDLLVRYSASFHNYSVGMKYGSDLFKYLDRHWITTNHCETGRSPKDGVYFVEEMSLIVWKERVFDALKERLRHNAIEVIDAARDKDLANLDDNDAVKSLLQTYEALGFEKRDRSQLFQTEMEDFLVESTGEYYSRRGGDLLQRLTVPRYLEEVETFLQKEHGRCISYVGIYSARRILVAAQKALIKAHSTRLVEEAAAMLSASPEKRQDLRRLYKLIGYLEDGESQGGGQVVENTTMKALEQVVREHVRRVGLRVVKDLQASGGVDESDDEGSREEITSNARSNIRSDDIVTAMLEVYDHYKGLMAESFDSSPGFCAVLDEACKAFINAVPRAPEWLARYAHCLLDKSCKESKIDEETRQDSLDHVGFLFAYISDKDIFHKYYSKLLSKRIIQLTSVSDEAEERMLRNMRKISGFEYTSKLQRMFVDKALSRDLHTGYVEWQASVRTRVGLLGGEEEGGRGDELWAATSRGTCVEGDGGYVYPAGLLQLPLHFEAFTFVLTAGCWPLQAVSSPFKPPAPIEDYVVSFLDFYGEVHSGRKLEWLYHLGHGEMVTHCFERTYRIYSSTFQIGLLHQFNDREEIAVSDLACGINVSSAEIVRHLFPLIKSGLLRLRGRDGSDLRPTSCDDIPSGSRARLNFYFSHKRSRVKINIVDHSRQPSKESKPSLETIQDRKMSVQAAICRVMKVRKEATHRDLVMQVCALCSATRDVGRRTVPRAVPATSLTSDANAQKVISQRRSILLPVKAITPLTSSPRN